MQPQRFRILSSQSHWAWRHLSRYCVLQCWMKRGRGRQLHASALTCSSGIRAMKVMLNWTILSDDRDTNTPTWYITYNSCASVNHAGNSTWPQEAHFFGHARNAGKDYRSYLIPPILACWAGSVTVSAIKDSELELKLHIKGYFCTQIYFQQKELCTK